MPQLDQWKISGRGDLSDCVERVLQAAEVSPPSPNNRVTLQEVDKVLAILASRCRFSGPKVRGSRAEDDRKAQQVLESIYRRLQSREAKWFTRMILKDYSCIALEERKDYVYHCLDSCLPIAMRMYDDFEAAVTELRSLPSSQTAGIVQRSWTHQCLNDIHLLAPRVGVKVGPPNWVKAKGGVKHAVSVADGRTMSIERKHDGEYCQVHIDLSKGQNCIQIFSKNGKDSTVDRSGVHEAIIEGLRIGRGGCGFFKRCILEGELLVWSDKTNAILDFHKIRKHVSRSGSFLGTYLDSQYVNMPGNSRQMLRVDRPHAWEHLMIVYYDVLLIDDEPVLHKSHTERRRHLEMLVTPAKGKADIVWQRDIRFSMAEGPMHLKKALAHAFVKRWEGLVLKPSDEPYFALKRSIKGRFPSRWIKLKKDCINGLGDTAEFAVVGAGYDAKQASKLGIPDFSWTHFYIGCLINKNAVLQSDAKPNFFVFDCVKDCIKKPDLEMISNHGKFRKMEIGSWQAREVFDLNIASFDPNLPKMQVIFTKPFVFEVAGSGFDMLPNRDIFTLRFPRVLKIHWDRDWRHAVALDELQKMAQEARMVPCGDLEKEVADWIKKLNQVDHGAESQLTSWDYSDGDGEGPPNYGIEPMTVSSPKSNRRVRTLIAPPMVRIDADQMLPDEIRANNREIVGRPASNHSMSSNITDGSLPTHPTSSPRTQKRKVGVVNIYHGQSMVGLPSSGNKRLASSSELTGDGRQTKKLRSNVLYQPRSKTNRNHSSTSISPKTPLQEIFNSSRSQALSRPPGPSLRCRRPKAPDALLGFQTGVGVNKHINNKPHRPDTTMEPTPPVLETTADECDSSDTSQETVFYDAVSELPTSPSRPTTEDSDLMAPSSTANAPITIQLPKLQEHHIILSPHLAKPDQHLRALLDAHSVTPSTLSQFLSSEQNGNLNVLNINKDLIFLIDANHSDNMTGPSESNGTGSQLRSLAYRIPRWCPHTLSIWSWHILELIGNERIPDDVKQTWAEHQFIAKMWWEPTKEDASRGEVVVLWGDGKSVRIDREVLETVEGME